MISQVINELGAILMSHTMSWLNGFKALSGFKA